MPHILKYFKFNNLLNYLKNKTFKSILVVASVTLLIKIIAFYKETLIAGTFGLNEKLDTFLVAMIFPGFIQSVFLNSLKNLFIPNYIIELNENPKNKGQFQSTIFLLTTAITILSILFIYISINFFLETLFPNQNTHYYDMVRAQLNIILPSLFFWGYSSVISGLLEIENKFLYASSSDFFPLISTIVIILMFRNSEDNILAYAVLIGSVLGFIYIFMVAHLHHYLFFKFPRLNKNSLQMLRQLPPKISSSFLSALNGFVDRFFAGQLAVGAISSLSYGNRIPAFFITIVVLALGNVLLPYFSKLTSQNIKVAYLKLFKILKIVFISGILIIPILWYTSDIIIELWLERDEFTHQDTLVVSGIQKILLLQIPFYLCTRIMVKFLTSINKNSFMAWISFFNLMMNILLNFYLMRLYGVNGLALSTSLVLILSSCFYFIYTYNNFKKIST